MQEFERKYAYTFPDGNKMHSCNSSPLNIVANTKLLYRRIDRFILTICASTAMFAVSMLLSGTYCTLIVSATLHLLVLGSSTFAFVLSDELTKRYSYTIADIYLDD